jgi:hypothetical protein
MWGHEGKSICSGSFEGLGVCSYAAANTQVEQDVDFRVLGHVIVLVHAILLLSTLLICECAAVFSSGLVLHTNCKVSARILHNQAFPDLPPSTAELIQATA